MAKAGLTNADFCRAAKRLQCSVSAIKAVAEVESRGKPFYADGFPVILFERHKFRKLTNGEFNTSHPHLSGPPGGYGRAGQNQRNKFNEALQLNPEAAMLSCSWGQFQIMGFNHEVCGYGSVGDFVDAMKESASCHLDAFVSFVIGNNLARHLRSRNFYLFAESYNGSDQEKNDYSGKMERAEKRFADENIDCSKDSAEAPATTNPPDGHQSASLNNVGSPSEHLQSEPPPINHELLKTNPVEVTKERISTFTKIGVTVTAFLGFIGAVGLNLGALLQEKLSDVPTPYFFAGIGCMILIALSIWLYDRSARRAHEKTLVKVEAAADPARNTVEIKP